MVIREKNHLPSFVSLFLIGEYSFRHIVKHDQNYKKIFESVEYVKKLSRKAFEELYPDEQYSDILDDAILLLHAFRNCEELTTLPADCFLYPYDRLTELSGIDKSRLISVHGMICTVPECKYILGTLVQISIHYGVYITHIDHFRSKDFSFNDFSRETIFEKSEPIFPSYKKFCSINNPESLKSMVNLLTGSEHLELTGKSILFGQLSFIVNLLNPEFNIDTALELIRNYLIAFSGYTNKSYLSLMEPNSPLFDEFIKIHLDVSLSKISESEFRNKLVGISMWDCVNFDRMGVADAVRKFRPKIEKSKHHDTRNIQDCEKKNCDECLNVEECERTTRRLYDVASDSIELRKIITSKTKLKRKNFTP